MVQLASLSGFLFAHWQRLAPPRRRLLVACGGAAGIAAAYNAPIAGALFIAEIVLRSISIESLGPLVAASVISSLTAHVFFGDASVYTMPMMPATPGSEIWLHGLLGVVAGLLAPCFLAVLDLSRNLFSRLFKSPPLRLGCGGLLVGLLSLLHPEVWGNGYSVVSGILAGQWLWQALLAVLVFKVIATVVTIGSGAIGGVFTPSLFVGAAVGCLFGYAAQAWLPALGDTTAFAVTGMAAFLAATIHAPLTATVVVVEMTGDLQRLPPAMLGVVVAVALSRLLRERSVYSDSLKPVATQDFARMHVRDVVRHDPPTVQLGDPLAMFEEAYVSSRWQHVYVIDDSGQFQGAVSIHDIGPLLRDASNAPDGKQRTLSRELLRTDYPRVSLDQHLSDALASFASHSGERLPVLDEAGKLVGYTSKTDLLLLLREGLAAD
jgi:CIC family chloride channel protein